MKSELLLSTETVRRLVSYDPDSGSLRYKNWKGEVSEKEAGGINQSGYRRITLNSVRLFAHRVAWLVHYGYWPSGQIDHINGDRTDNRIINLRDVEHIVNTHNIHGPRCDNKGGVLGASMKPNGKWLSQIVANGVHYYLGLHPTSEDAHNAYIEAKRRLHPTSDTAMRSR